MEDLLAQNAYIEATQLIEVRDKPFVDADIPQMAEHGIDLIKGAEYYVHNYTGDNNFVKNVLRQKLRLTAGQARAALNILREELTGTVQNDESVKTLECFVCGEEFPTWDELNAHKSQEHSKKNAVVDLDPKNGEKIERVIEDTTATLGLDLSNLPDGRYAVPDPTGKNEYMFFMVKRVRKTHRRDRRYVYGKITTGNEVTLAGTIEVKTWSSDSKELIGEQKPGDVYRGKWEEQIKLIMMAPEMWGILFGKMMGYCTICGKKLTDDLSRAIGMGIECEKKENYFSSKPKYTYIGKDRPDPSKADDKDIHYYSSEAKAKYMDLL